MIFLLLGQALASTDSGLVLWADARFSAVAVETPSLYVLEQVSPALAGTAPLLEECLVDAGVPYESFRGTFDVTSGGRAVRSTVNASGLNMDNDVARALERCVSGALSAFVLPPRATRAPSPQTRVHYAFEADTAFIE